MAVIFGLKGESDGHKGRHGDVTCRASDLRPKHYGFDCRSGHGWIMTEQVIYTHVPVSLNTAV